MDSPYSLCVILCFATTVAVALPESSEGPYGGTDGRNASYDKETKRSQ